MDNSSEASAFVDRISNLPDSILSHILSFLPTKQAVVTSILSRRWEVLWTLVDTLDFCDDHESHPSAEDPSKMQFAQFVHRVLQLHSSPLIRKMHIWCEGGVYSEHDVVKWIQTAISKSVQRLDLHFNIDIKWPPCLFHSQTLVELKLNSADIINLPTPPFLPNLKFLHLHCPKCDPTSLERFISGCSILEIFFILFTYSSYFGTYRISSATLKTFFSLQSPDLLLRKRRKFILNAPALESLKIKDSQLLVESTLPSLRKAQISFWFPDLLGNSMSLVSLSYLDCLSNVTILCLTVCHRRAKLDLHAHFHHLTKLEIGAPLFGLDILRNFLEKSNNLQSVTLIKEWSDPQHVPLWDEPQHVPKCLSSSLQTMCIRGYENEEHVPLMIKYVLGNAKKMKSLEIHASNSSKNNTNPLIQKISKFPKASGCEISFF